MRYRIEIPAEDGAAAVRALVETWSHGEPLRRLVEAHGGDWPAEGDLVERLEALEEFSERWDFRRGGERLDIVVDAANIDEPLVRAAASELGIADSVAPAAGRYEHALILGGTVLASIYRTRHVKELLDGGTEIGRIAALGALRPVPDAELELVRDRAELRALVDPAPATEFDALVAAAVHFLAPDAEVDRREHHAQIGPAVEVLAAPAADPARRATTLDNYRAYADNIAPGDGVLCVTSAVYCAHQFFAGLHALGWDRPYTLESVGFPPEWMRGVLTGPQNLLQETRSGIRGALMLARDLPAPPG